MSANVCLLFSPSIFRAVQSSYRRELLTFNPRGCYTSLASVVRSENQARRCSTDASQTGARSRRNALEQITEGSSMTLRQWTFSRYAILSTLQHSALMDMLMRRHELAMACIARQILDASSAHGDIGVNPAAGNRKKAPVTKNTPDRSCFGTAHYAVQSGESFNGWLHRLRCELPQARSSKRVYVVSSETSGEFDIQYEAVPTPEKVEKSRAQLKKLLGKSLEPRTKRVLFEEGLPYTQFVAALGTQLLLQVQRWARRAAQSKEIQPSRQLSQTLLVESLLAIEAHSLAPQLLDESKTRTPSRQEVEEMVQTVIMSRGVDYSIDPDQQLSLSLLALQLARQKGREN